MGPQRVGLLNLFEIVYDTQILEYGTGKDAVGFTVGALCPCCPGTAWTFEYLQPAIHFVLNMVVQKTVYCGGRCRQIVVVEFGLGQCPGMMGVFFGPLLHLSYGQKSVARRHGVTFARTRFKVAVIFVARSYGAVQIVVNVLHSSFSMILIGHDGGGVAPYVSLIAFALFTELWVQTLYIYSLPWFYGFIS